MKSQDIELLKSAFASAKSDMDKAWDAFQVRYRVAMGLLRDLSDKISDSEDGDKLSNCCGAPQVDPDSDICPQCKEHCDFEAIDED